jgi:NDP-sugar pyrophosphorylase family protein
LDTAGAVRFAADAAGIDERFVVCNGDVLTDQDLSALLAQHERTGAEGTILLTRVDDPSRYGVVPIDADGRVQAFVEKPPVGEAPTDWINAGTYVFEPSVLQRIPAGVPTSIERVTFPAMVADGSLFARQDGAYWIDTGTPDSYLQASFDLIDGVRGAPLAPIAADAHVDVAASVDHSVVGPGATIAAGAKVHDAVVLAGAVVGADALVEGSIVGPGATIGAGAQVTGLSIIGAGAHVAPGEVLEAARRPESGV